MRGLTSVSRPGGGLPPPGPPLLDFARTALFLDLDGTLAGFESRPELVGPDQDRTRRLRALGPRLGGRLAILSGRSIVDIDRILEASVPATAGVHGHERRAADGRILSGPAHPSLGEVVEAFNAFAGARPGVIVEVKPQSAALHYRNAPEAGDAARALAEGFARSTGLVLQEGAMVFELRSPGADKGDALKAFMREPPFAGARPLMVGDDLTDEAAFRAAAALGGAGVLVGPERPTAAAWRLEDPAEVAAWLDQSLAGAEPLAPRTGVQSCRA